ncbi:MAG: hypothetical protein KH972_02650 [Peptostreptococcaceae bacterium]|nr:hypothetical protein [Peptostreptococcaceae bacterium]
MIKATGEGQAECPRCRELGKWSHTWVCFLYKVEGHEGCYCKEHAEELDKEERNGQ